MQCKIVTNETKISGAIIVSKLGKSAFVILACRGTTFGNNINIVKRGEGRKGDIHWEVKVSVPTVLSATIAYKKSPCEKSLFYISLRERR